MDREERKRWIVKRIVTLRKLKEQGKPPPKHSKVIDLFECVCDAGIPPEEVADRIIRVEDEYQRRVIRDAEEIGRENRGAVARYYRRLGVHLFFIPMY